MTTEQLIILGFLAAAFIAGWLARALIGRGTGPRRPSRAAPGRLMSEAANEAANGVGEAPTPVLDERLAGAIEATRRELDRAIQSHVAAVALSLAVRETGPGASRRLADEVSAALQDDVANESMLSVMDSEQRRGAERARARPHGLGLRVRGRLGPGPRARARSRRAKRSPARPAQLAADPVFRAYAAEAELGAAAATGNRPWTGDEPAKSLTDRLAPHPPDRRTVLGHASALRRP